ncbi:muramidase-2 precursor [bacterium BMS3Abin02]|nr:muramidase-2 precursor [bacterium BMS3Abin02]GBE21722.1 muramidase-2 precursor [bacterium BMS3Bbin01]
MVLAVAATTATYVVVSGDSLSRIAARNGTTVQALVDANHIENPNSIAVGQVLIIPNDKAYIVQAGDTLEGIAKQLGITVERLARANGITDPNRIYVGARLEVGTDTAAFDPEVRESQTYTVRRGDTLSAIALRFATSVDRLVDTNAIKDPNLITAGTVLTVSEGAWLCPVAGATFFNDWGFPRSGGRFHTGNDLFASRGTPVLAPVGGIVRQVTGSIGGFQVNLLANDGTLYIASHLDHFGAAGAVAAGQIIGYVGDSGNAIGSRPHVHFEVHPDSGDAVNPYPVLSKACR